MRGILFAALFLTACAQDKGFVVNPNNPNEITITDPKLMPAIEMWAAMQHKAIVDKCPRQIGYSNPKEQTAKNELYKITMPAHSQKTYDDSVRSYAKKSCSEIIKERITGKNYKFLKAL